MRRDGTTYGAITRRWMLKAAGPMVGLLALGGLAACSPETDGAAGGGAELKIVGSARAWKGLDPAASAVSTARTMLFAVYDPLFRLDADGKVIPWLVKEWERSDDGLQWTFKLQENVKFHDGTPFDAEAVKFNLQRQIDPKQRAGEGGNLPKDMTIEVKDPLTVLIHLPKPVESLPAALASTSVGLIASPTAVKTLGDKYGLEAVGTGPFVLESQIVGQTARFTKNPNYWVEGQPKVDSMTYTLIDSAQAGLQSLKSGEAHILDNAQPKQVSEVREDTNFQVISGKTTTINQFILNIQKPPFDDLRARLALAYAINQEELIKNVFYGIGIPAQSMIASGSWAYPGATVQGYPTYDLEKAKALVTELGGLEFTGLFYQNAEGQETGTAIQSQLAKAGIKMTVSTPDSAQRIADVFGGKFEATNFAVFGMPDPDSLMRPWYDPSGSNPSGVHDEQLSALFAEARSTPGEEKRAALYKLAAQRMAQLMPVVYLGEWQLTKIARKEVVGFMMPPAEVVYLNDVSLGSN